MTPELDAQLCERHPDIFKSASLYEGKLGWHFECLDGWYGIIDAFCGLLYDYQSRGRAPEAKIYRIREKFGLLEINCDGTDEYTDGLIDMSSALSRHTCEVCGQKGTLIEAGGWLSTRCNEHAQQAD